jgi:signal transduction histidine kinase
VWPVRINLRPPLADALLATGLTGLTLATLAAGTAGHVNGVAAVLAVLTAAPLALRQRAPILTLIVIEAALSAYGFLGFGDYPNGGVGMLVGMFTVATFHPRPVAAWMFATTLGPCAIYYFTATSPVVWSQVVQGILIVCGGWVLGESTRRWGRRAERLGEDAARAVADERLRIARELHDVVAHHMSVISLQAGLAEYVLDADAQTAKVAIATVGDASRDALTDMRRLLDLLRLDESDDDDDYQPQPGIAQLDGLVSRMRGAGLPVTVRVHGEAHRLPVGADLCVYRIVQESLTNVLKHAGPAAARIDITYGEHILTVKISDDGRAPGRPETPASHGIRGMRERAELYGGVLSAAPAPEGGFTVVLRMPLQESR